MSIVILVYVEYEQAFSLSRFWNINFGKNNSKFLIIKDRKELHDKIDLRNLMIKNVLNQMKNHLDEAIIA